MQILIKEINSPLVSIEGGQEADARWDWCHACVYLCVCMGVIQLLSKSHKDVRQDA